VADQHDLSHAFIMLVMTKFDPVTLVFLVRTDDAPDIPDDEAERLQDAHLAHQAALADQGLVLVAGPLTDQDDEAMRGICVLSVDADRARTLYADDPAVRAGRLAVRVATWLVPTGGATFPGIRLPASAAEARAD
jgi:uncharacterized protein YciI